jgi:tetratricopeptide (TPR) repeat protein
MTEELSELDEIEADWLANRSLSFASEFVSAAIVLRQEERARDAAQFIVAHSGTQLERQLAGRILSTDGGVSRIQYVVPTEEDSSTEATGARVHSLRVRLRRDPRNAIAWADLSHEYAALGLSAKAEHAMGVALALGPENRFLLRAGARLYVHLDQPDRAHDLVLQAAASRRDPWLMATEIAVAQVAELNPKLIRSGRQLLEAGHLAPRHLSELASSIGTSELKAGNERRARQLFRSSLEGANDNSLAQAAWATRHLSGLDLTTSELIEPIAFEARARLETREGRWKDAVDEAWRWHLDQPFASDASVFGSYAAAVGLLDFDEAIHVAEAGLIANRGHATLLNNFAYASLEAGYVSQAREAIARIDAQHLEDHERVAYLATAGLLAFRSGDPETGSELYRRAIDLAGSRKLTEMRAMASIKLALEEVLAESPGRSRSIDDAIQTSAQINDPGVEIWRQILIQRLGLG